MEMAECLSATLSPNKVSNGTEIDFEIDFEMIIAYNLKANILGIITGS